jgi:acetyltransferase-like isoleucine patch superfamily enzyme
MANTTSPADAGGHDDDEGRLGRVLASVASPATWLHVLRLLNHASYDHVQPRRAMQKGPGVRIGPTASFRNGERIFVGARARIGDRCCLWADDAGGVIRLGDDALLAPGVFITTSNYEIPAGEPVIGQPSTSADVTVGTRTWLGANVIVLPGVTIGDGCVVGAGSVVTRSLPPESIAVGNPARVVGTRPERSGAGRAGPA